MTTTIPTPDHVDLADLGAAARNQRIRTHRRGPDCYQRAADRLAEAFDLLTRGASLTGHAVIRLRAEAHVLIADRDTVDHILGATPQGFLAIEPDLCPVTGESMWLWLAHDPDVAGREACGYVLPNGTVDIYGDCNTPSDPAEVIDEMRHYLANLTGRALDYYTARLGLVAA